MRPPKADLEPIWAAQRNKAPAPTIQQQATPADLREALAEGVAIVESAIAHVSHGGPTREDAEKWLQKAKAVLAGQPMSNSRGGGSDAKD